MLPRAHGTDAPPNGATPPSAEPRPAFIHWLLGLEREGREKGGRGASKSFRCHGNGDAHASAHELRRYARFTHHPHRPFLRAFFINNNCIYIAPFADGYNGRKR